MKAAIYCRVSDPAQERGTSLTSQHASGVAHCERRGHEIIAVEMESEGGEFIYARTKYLELIARSDVEVIVIDKPDRLGRGRTRPVLEFFAQDAGKIIEYATEQPDDTTVVGMASRLAQDLASGVERLNIRDRMTRGRNARAKAGRIIAGRVPPFGYDYKTERDHRGRVVSCDLVIDEAKIGIYRMMVGWLLDGIPSESVLPMTIRGICKRLTTMAIPTPSPKSNQWSYQTVQKILRNRVYSGHWEYGRNIWRLEDRRGGAKGRIVGKRSDAETIVVPCPPAITMETWQAVQARLDQNKAELFIGPAKYKYLLRGMVTCAACGYKLIGERHKGGNGTHYTYYTCHQRRHRWVNPCRVGKIRMPLLDEAVLHGVRLLADNDSLLEGGHREIRRGGADFNYFEASIKAQERAVGEAMHELEKLTKLMLGKDEDSPSMEVYRGQELLIEQRIKGARNIIADLKRDQATAQMVAREMKSVDTLRAELLAMPATATFEQRRAALEKIKTHCVWDSEGRMMTISCIFGEVALSI